MSIEIGERLAELREEQGLTQEDLAEQIPVGRSTIGSYETNNSQPSYAVLIELADVFGVSTDYLLGRTKIRNARFFREQFQDKALEGVLVELLQLNEEERRDIARHVHALLASRELERIKRKKTDK